MPTVLKQAISANNSRSGRVSCPGNLYFDVFLPDPFMAGAVLWFRWPGATRRRTGRK
jgi:hypothetical protein